MYKLHEKKKTLPNKNCSACFRNFIDMKNVIEFMVHFFHKMFTLT